MKNMIPALVGAVLVGVIAWLMWGREVGDLRQTVASLETKSADAEARADQAATTAALRTDDGKRRATTIMLKRHPMNLTECTAEVEYGKMHGQQTRKVAWIIDNDEMSPCNPGANFRVDLKFLPTDGKIPFNDEWVLLNRDVKAERIIKTGEMATKSYKYEVHLFVAGTRTKLLDPDLEVDPPPSPLVPPAAPPANPPATPPAKKP